jgi:hypothetical protein
MFGQYLDVCMEMDRMLAFNKVGGVTLRRAFRLGRRVHMLIYSINSKVEEELTNSAKQENINK